MGRISKLVICTAVSFFSASIYADADISGNYKCTGYDANAKSNYETELVIQKTGSTYNLTWKLGDITYFGTGMFSKTAHDVLASTFVNSKEKEKAGLIIYQAKNDGSLDGSWVYANGEVVSSESCNKSK